MRFKNELERNITIKLGYANAKLYKCENPVSSGTYYASIIMNRRTHGELRIVLDRSVTKRIPPTRKTSLRVKGLVVVVV